MLSQFVFVLKIKINRAFPLSVSVLIELKIRRLRYSLTDAPPQPNSPPVSVPDADPRGLDPEVRQASLRSTE